MTAMKPRAGEGPLEIAKEGRSIMLRIPADGGGRIVLEMTPKEAQDLSQALVEALG